LTRILLLSSVACHCCAATTFKEELMSRPTRIGLAMIALFVASPAFAAAIKPGATRFAIELTAGTADLAQPEEGLGYVPLSAHSELGAQLEYSKMMSSDYALSFSGGAAFSREVLKPGDNALPGEPQLDYEQTSWNVRVGGERVVNVGERAAFYFGPGVEYWSGSAKFDDVFIAATVRSPTTKRVSLTGRIGGLMTIGSSWGLTSHVGYRAGYAWAEESGAKSTWWPSSFDAGGGVVFLFGGGSSDTGPASQ
jgi:hypothetical protein